MRSDLELVAGAALLVALGELTEGQRYVFVMRHVHGRKLRDIAALRGIGTARVWQLEQDARRRLKASLETHSPEFRQVAA